MLIVLGWYKYNSKLKKNGNTEKSLKYTDNNDVPDLFASTDDNPSYKHIQHPSTSAGQNEIPLRPSLPHRSSPLYENPDEFLEIKFSSNPIAQDSSISETDSYM